MMFLIIGILFATIFCVLFAHALLAGGGDDIPTVPLYINCLALFKGEGRVEFYQNHLRGHLERSGVVRTWLAGHWSLLITRPDLLTEVFKNEHVFSKAGFQKKVPYGIFAYLFGDNIIDAHGKEWKSLINYMKPGFQDRLADYQQLKDLSNRFIDLLLSEQSMALPGGISSDEPARRWALAVAGEHFLQMDFRSLTDPHAPIMRMMDNIGRIAPTPLLSTFPFLEKIDWVWPGRRDKIKVVDEFHAYLQELADKTPTTEVRDSMEFWRRASVLEGLKKGQREKEISDDEFMGNIVITLFAGHENVLSLVKSAIWELGNRPKLQAALRSEALQTMPTTREDIVSMPLLGAVVLETGRLYPPISQLANRVTLEPVVLGGKHHLPKGQWVGWNAYGVQTSTQVWGADALDFKPERWGQGVEEIDKMFRRAQNSGAYIAFNAHARKCLGMSFALLQTKLVLLEMVRRMEWKVDPNYKYTVAPVCCVFGC